MTWLRMRRFVATCSLGAAALLLLEGPPPRSEFVPEHRASQEFLGEAPAVPRPAPRRVVLPPAAPPLPILVKAIEDTPPPPAPVAPAPLPAGQLVAALAPRLPPRPPPRPLLRRALVPRPRSISAAVVLGAPPLPRADPAPAEPEPTDPEPADAKPADAKPADAKMVRDVVMRLYPDPPVLGAARPEHASTAFAP